MLNKTDLSRADLNLLVLFEAVLNEGSVARAAERLSVSPSAVSHGLNRLRSLLNDPLFLRNPKGMVPTTRALELAGPIEDILARVRAVVDAAEGFDPARSSRRFTIGAPDGVSAILLPRLFARAEKAAPLIDLCELAIRPEDTFMLLDTRAVDLVIGPVVAEPPARFESRPLFEEDFVIGMRAGHALAGDLSLEQYCAAAHLLVSSAGSPKGLVDEALGSLGRSRRIAYVAPNFMLALAILSETDLIAALPRRLVEKHCRRFGLTCVEAPLKLESYSIAAVVPQVALADAGIAWLLEILEDVCGGRKDSVRS